MIKDGFGRTVSYLRLSVTDRCNLNCLYCRPQANQRFIPHQDILSYEEMLYLLGIVSGMDVQKVRLTGGEPFVRRDFLDFLARVRQDYPELDVRLTTNATLLHGKVKALKATGIKGLNISLDTLDREKYCRITGRDCLSSVMSSIDDCLEQGLRVKINVVALKKINDDELSGLIRLAIDNPLDLRFIEFMPVGVKTLWRRENFWPAADILKAAQEIVTMHPVAEAEKDHGPARMFVPDQGQGRIGLISPLSNHFCEQCNRLRITADGRLRTCLFSDRDYRLLPLIRSSRISPERLQNILEKAGQKKPMGHEMIGRVAGSQNSICSRIMSSIGG